MRNEPPASEKFLSLRLGANDAALVQRLHERMGLSKSEIVKQALRLMAETDEQQASIYELGKVHFGRYGDAQRQSAQIKTVVRGRANGKRKP